MKRFHLRLLAAAVASVMALAMPRAALADDQPEDYEPPVTAPADELHARDLPPIDVLSRAPAAIAPPLPAPLFVPPPSLAPVRKGGVMDIDSLPNFGLFAAGAISALTLHESGHLITNLAFGNVPGFTPILYAKFIPFFVIDPHLHACGSQPQQYCKSDGSRFGAGRDGYYVINMAGFQMQNIGSELLLSIWPDLYYRHAPYRKGMLAMDIFLSIGYGTFSLLGIEDPHGDLSGANERDLYPKALLASAVILPAAVDLYRYFFPESRWAPWVSRTAKAGLLGMDLCF
jgi:hypothetical protein